MKGRIVAVALIVVAAVAGGVGYYWNEYVRPRPLRFAVKVHASQSPLAAVRLFTADREVAAFSALSFDTAVEASPQPRHRDIIPPSFRATLTFPCGESQADVKVNPIDPAAVARWTAEGAAVPLEVYLYAPPPVPQVTVKFWIDNIGGDATTVAVGGQTEAIAANIGTQVDFTYMDCPPARQVAINGAAAGVLPAGLREAREGESSSVSLGYIPDDSAVAPSLQFLIDPTGKRCYRFAEHYYTPRGGTLYGYAPPSSEFYRPMVIRHLPTAQVDFFLEENPQKTTSSFGGTTDLELKNSLRSVSCR